MTGPQPAHRLHVLLAALAILTALSVSAAVMEKPAGPAQDPKVAKAAQAIPNASAAAHAVAAPPAATTRASTAGVPAGAPPTTPRARGAAAPVPSPSAPAASPARGGEAVGRANPFAPPGFARPPARPGAPTFGLDLPLPPGVPGAAGPAAAPPPPPGAGMVVGAIAGAGSERVAIIQRGGQVFVVGVGDSVGDAAVVEVRDDKVVMRKGAVTFELLYGGGAP